MDPSVAKQRPTTQVRLPACLLVCYCAFGVIAFGVLHCVLFVEIKRACEIVPVSLSLLFLFIDSPSCFT